MELGFKYPQNVRRTIDDQAINHIIKRHGVDSVLVKNGQKAVTMQDISKWIEYADSATKQKSVINSDEQEVIVSGKQINGYYIIVEQIKKGQNELGLKTMYFEGGKLENNEIFKDFGTPNA